MADCGERATRVCVCTVCTVCIYHGILFVGSVPTRGPLTAGLSSRKVKEIPRPRKNRVPINARFHLPTPQAGTLGRTIAPLLRKCTGQPLTILQRDAS